MDIHQGLLENLEIEWRGRRLIQRIDYLGIPFRCSVCRSTAHLRRDCTGLVDSEVDIDDSAPNYVEDDPSLDTGFYGPGPFPLAQEDGSISDSTKSTVGKLKKYCPTLFSTLSFLERDALNSSEWLSSSTSNVDCSSVQRRGVHAFPNPYGWGS
jgi:hypothetical protein